MTREDLDACLLSIAQGKQEALYNLYDALYQSVFLLAASLSGDSRLAEDAVQEVFLIIHDCAPRYRAGANPRAWIYGITRNVTRDMMRRHRQETLAENPSEAESSYSSSFEKSCLDGIVVLEALKSLSAEEYRITVLHVFGDFKLTEIAEYLHIPYGTVLWRYSEAKKKLRRHYATQNVKEDSRHE